MGMPEFSCFLLIRYPTKTVSLIALGLATYERCHSVILVGISVSVSGGTVGFIVLELIIGEVKEERTVESGSVNPSEDGNPSVKVTIICRLGNGMIRKT